MIILSLLFATATARADVTNVEVLVTYTNVVRGVTNGDNLTITGDTRLFTNGVLNALGTWIQSTNIVGWAATNTQIHLSTYTPAGIERVFSTNTNAIVIVSLNGVFPTVTLSAGVGTVTYGTNVWSDESILRFPQGALYNEADRTNNVSGLIGLLNDTGGRASNTVANGILALGNLIDRISQQVMSNKLAYLFTNRGGLSDGNRFTNGVALNASNVILAQITLLDGTGAHLTNSTLVNIYITGVSNLSGLIGALTNGVLWSNVITRALITNSIFGGTVTYFTNGYWTNAALDSPQCTNATLWGDVLTPLALSDGIFSVGYGNLVISLGDVVNYGFYNAVGNASLGGNSIINYGANNALFGENLYAFGAGNTVSNASLIYLFGSENNVTNASYSVSIGRGNTVTNSFCVVIGSFGRTTKNNQVIFPGATNSFRIDGALELDTGATNFQTTVNSTNILRGDISFPRATVTTVANGHNTINIGTNVFVDLTGSPSAAWTWGGITGGNRDGKYINVRNNTGYACDILDNSGTEPTAALRIDTPTGTNITLNSGGAASFIYDSSASRWVLLNVFNTATPVASATNAVTLGENLGLTNATRMGVFYQVQGQTNIQLRSLQAGSGVVLTNEGTNIVIAATAIGGAGEANVNGEVSLTNATMFGLVNGKAGVTNLLRSIAARYGLNGTNEGGTNISFAIDPAIVATVSGLANKVDNINGVATNLTLTNATFLRYSTGPNTNFITWFSNGFLLTFRTTNGVETGVPVMTLNVTNGNVGIGTNGPQATAHIIQQVAGAAAALRIDDTNGLQRVVIGAYADEGNYGAIHFGTATPTGINPAFYGDGSSLVLNAAAASGEILFRTGNSTKAVLKGTSTLFGIGDGSPQASLHVSNVVAQFDPLRIYTKTGDGALFAFGVASNRLALFGATAITNTPPAGYAGMFAETNTGVIELAVIDSAGNVTQISPHPRDCPPSFLITTNWLSGWPEVGKTVKLFNGTVTWKNNSLSSLVQRWQLESTILASNYMLLMPAPLRALLPSALISEESFDEYNTRIGLTPGHGGLVENNWDVVQASRQNDYNLCRTNELIAFNTPWVFTNDVGDVISNQFNTSIIVRPVRDVKEPKPALIEFLSPEIRGKKNK